MPEITLLSSGLPDLVPMLDRSPGIHVSDIIRDLMIRQNKWESNSSPDVNLMNLGKALEWAICNMYQTAFPARYVQLGELELDDIYGHLDLFDIADYAVMEIKYTKRSARNVVEGEAFEREEKRAIIWPRFSDKFWKDAVQAMAYCKMMGSTILKLILCHVEGNYEKDFKERKVVYNVWQARCTQDEIDANWNMLRRHRDRMLIEMESAVEVEIQ